MPASPRAVDGSVATDGPASVSPPDNPGTPPALDAAAPPVSTMADAGTGPVVTTPPPGGWWDAKWTHRSKLTISDSALKEALTDFQVPVKLDATGIDYAAARPDGQDLRVVTADGMVLDAQIDSWDPMGTSLLWVKLPRLDGTPLSLFVYYGNAAAEAAPGQVWPAPYTGVWHLSGDAKDSTPNGNDGAMMVGGSFVAGQLGKGLHLDRAAKEHIVLKGDIKLVAGAAGCTFSAWINPNNIEDSVNGMIIMTVGKWFNNNHNSFTDFNVNAAGQMISHVDPGTNTGAGGYSRILSDPGFIKASEWAWVTYVIDLAAKEERFFKNGMLVSTKPPPPGGQWASTFIDMVSTRVVIGSEEDNVSHWYTGTMDELRIEKGMRTPGWIGAQYRSMTVPTYAKVEKQP